MFTNYDLKLNITSVLANSILKRSMMKLNNGQAKDWATGTKKSDLNMKIVEWKQTAKLTTLPKAVRMTFNDL